MISKPAFSKSPLTPLQQKGLTYERKVFKHFKKKHWPGDLLYSPWFREGSSLHNPDILLVQPHLVVIFECKLSQTELAVQQLKRYSAVCHTFFGLPCACVQIFRNLFCPCNLITTLPTAPNSYSQWHLFL